MVGHCEYHSGSVLTISWLSDQDIPLPTVIQINELVGITTRPIKNEGIGGINVDGGVYRFIGEVTFGVGEHVYWNDTSKKVSTNSGIGPYIGKTVSPGETDGEVLVMHIQCCAVGGG